MLVFLESSLRTEKLGLIWSGLGARHLKRGHQALGQNRKAEFKVRHGQHDTDLHTLAYTRNGGFYFDAGACQAIIDGRMKVGQGYPDRFTEIMLC